MRESLAARSVGRVGFDGPDGPQILPVNYVVLRRSIYFRTETGSALANAMSDRPVAFEVDEFLQAGWSVLAVGDAALVDDHDLLVELWGEQGPQPWQPGCARGSSGSRRLDSPDAESCRGRRRPLRSWRGMPRKEMDMVESPARPRPRCPIRRGDPCSQARLSRRTGPLVYMVMSDPALRDELRALRARPD
ncbi:pyridoxamine 5'-phosphate oxidase family protein [Kribbella sp. NPDC023972]|uniref:pyridoxamine 5'-phosphate oxidase family protein n=1 Tax=Kribbella sp. NPDC023972 TaxID=3154795 RepID=UPI00340BB693